MTNIQPVSIDIVSDIVCPWCVIGYRQLQGTLDATGIDVDIRWHPFQLNPDMPQEGQNHIEYLSVKYGRTREQVLQTREQITSLGKQLGFSFNYSEEIRTYNTFDVHQLLHWAGEQGRQTELKLALFECFFSNGEDLSDRTVLKNAVERVGLDGDEAVTILADGRYVDAVRKEQRMWIERGIQGVPAMIFNQRYLLSGAQGIDRYSDVLTQLNTGEAA